MVLNIGLFNRISPLFWRKYGKVIIVLGFWDTLLSEQVMYQSCSMLFIVYQGEKVMKWMCFWWSLVAYAAGAFFVLHSRLTAHSGPRNIERLSWSGSRGTRCSHCSVEHIHDDLARLTGDLLIESYSIVPFPWFLAVLRNIHQKRSQQFHKITIMLVC